MPRKRILILGAGLTGLSVAWHLQKRGIDCQIFEKEPEVGGLCRSKKINGFTFDYDGHLLHFRHRYTFNLVRALLRDNLREHRRNSFIYSHGRYTRYPFQANLYGLPSEVAKECLMGFVEASEDGRPKNPATFLDWINSTFGKGIARHFMIPYNTKFWTLPPKELTCDWLDGFVPVPSLSQVIEGTIEESQRQFGYNSRFWYPRRGGISQIALSFASQVKNIHTNCQIVEIDLDKKDIKTSFGNKEKFDYLISTISLPEIPYLVRGLPKQARVLFKKLRWNSIFNLNLGVEEKDYSGRHWVYFPQKELCFFRVGFFNNFSSYLAPAGRSSLYAEVAYSKEMPIHKSNIVSRIKEDLKKARILTDDTRIYAQDANDIKYGYPIYDKNYRQSRERILGFLSKNNIISCGRYGSWRYMSIEESILEGKEAVRHLK